MDRLRAGARQQKWNGTNSRNYNMLAVNTAFNDFVSETVRINRKKHQQNKTINLPLYLEQERN